MVNEWSPDPPQNHCDAEVGPVGSSTFTVVGGSSSDSENDEVGNNGYELLPMTPVEDLGDNSDPEDEESDCDSQTVPQSVNAEGNDDEESHINPSKTDSLQSSEVQASPECSQEMDPELMEKVRAAMSGFSLPLTAVPSWAFHIPEEEWRSHLVERMQSLQERGGRPPPANQSDTNKNSK